MLPILSVQMHLFIIKIIFRNRTNYRKMTSHRKSQHTHTQTFGEGYTNSQPKFDPEKELTNRTKEIAELLHKIGTEDAEMLDREKNYYGHQGDYNYNRISQYRNDKARERSSEEEQRKLFLDIENRLDQTNIYKQKIMDEVKQLKSNNQLTDRCTQEILNSLNIRK